jgi:hypothetical protein
MSNFKLEEEEEETKVPDNESTVQMQSEIDRYMQQGEDLLQPQMDSPLENPASTIREDYMLARMPIVADRYMRYFPEDAHHARESQHQPEEKQSLSLWRSRVKPLEEVAPTIIDKQCTPNDATML